jgi:transcription termination factor Rho
MTMEDRARQRDEDTADEPITSTADNGADQGSIDEAEIAPATPEMSDNGAADAPPEEQLEVGDGPETTSVLDSDRLSDDARDAETAQRPYRDRGDRRRRDRDRDRRGPRRDDGIDVYERAERDERTTAGERRGGYINVAELQAKTREELGDLAATLDIEGYSGMRKQDLIFRILQAQSEKQGNIFTGGTLEVVDDGYGFLRNDSMRPSLNDVYVSQSQVRRFALRNGDYITGQVRPPRDNEKYYGLLRVEQVNGLDPEDAKKRPFFENLTPIFPVTQLNLETNANNLTGRIINLICPIGRGQRGLIVSPPKAGKTTVMKLIAQGVMENAPDVHLIVLLIGERPEEVTDMRRSVRGEVIASTFDESVDDQTHVAELALERAKRLCEMGVDVVILLDGITRLVRAYNVAMPPSGRTLSGGIDPIAVFPPKRIFGAARATEEAGSLTILATCLIDTGSRMDEVIFEEFKGTGNMELFLDRRMSERRVFPAIDIMRSSTRREELMLDQETLRQVWLVRRMTAMISSNSPNPTEATERLLERLSKTDTNAEFLQTLKQEV